MHLLMILLAGVFFVCRVHTKILHFTMCINCSANHERVSSWLTRHKGDNGGDLCVNSNK